MSSRQHRVASALSPNHCYITCFPDNTLCCFLSSGFKGGVGRGQWYGMECEKTMHRLKTNSPAMHMYHLTVVQVLGVIYIFFFKYRSVGWIDLDFTRLLQELCIIYQWTRDGYMDTCACAHTQVFLNEAWYLCTNYLELLLIMSWQFFILNLKKLISCEDVYFTVNIQLQNCISICWE